MCLSSTLRVPRYHPWCSFVTILTCCRSREYIYLTANKCLRATRCSNLCSSASRRSWRLSRHTSCFTPRWDRLALLLVLVQCTWFAGDPDWRGAASLHNWHCSWLSALTFLSQISNLEHHVDDHASHTSAFHNTHPLTSPTTRTTRFLLACGRCAKH